MTLPDDALDALLATPPRSASEALERAERLRVRNARVEANQGLVHHVARRFVGRGVDGSRGTHFGAYAGCSIRPTIRNGIAGTARTVRLPSTATKLAGAFRARAGELTDVTGRPPTFDQVAEEMKLSTFRRRVVRAALLVLSVAGPEALDLASDPPRDGTAEDERRRLGEALRALPERRRAVVELRHGLGDGEALGLADVGRRLGVSKQRVNQIEAKAIDRLRELLRA